MSHEISEEGKMGVDPMATAKHLHFLEIIVVKSAASSFSLGEKFDISPSLSKVNIERMANSFCQEMGEDAQFLDSEVLMTFLTEAITNAKSNPASCIGFLYGMAIALQLKPVPCAGKGFFWGEGIAES